MQGTAHIRPGPTAVAREYAGTRPPKVHRRHVVMCFVVARALHAAQSQRKRYTTCAALSDHPDVAPHTALAALNTKLHMSCSVWTVTGAGGAVRGKNSEMAGIIL